MRPLQSGAAAVKVGSPSKAGEQPAVPGNLLEMQILRPHPGLPASAAGGRGASNLCPNGALCCRPERGTSRPRKRVKPGSGAPAQRPGGDGRLVGWVVWSRVEGSVSGRPVRPEGAHTARREEEPLGAGAATSLQGPEAPLASSRQTPSFSSGRRLGLVALIALGPERVPWGFWHLPSGHMWGPVCPGAFEARLCVSPTRPL